MVARRRRLSCAPEGHDVAPSFAGGSVHHDRPRLKQAVDFRQRKESSRHASTPCLQCDLSGSLLS